MKNELTSQRYQELSKLKKELLNTSYKDEKHDEKMIQLNDVQEELQLYIQAAEEQLKTLVTIPSFQRNILHGINRITNGGFTEISLEIKDGRLKVSTETQSYLGDLNNFITTLQAVAEGWIDLDPDKRERSMKLRIHIYYTHPSGGSNGCEAEPKLIIDFRELGSLNCGITSIDTTDVPVRVGG